MMDGYRMIELGQELRYANEMGAKLQCLLIHFTPSPPSPWQLARLQLPMRAVSAQLAVDFQRRSATLASGNGESMEKFAEIVEEILYPTLSNSVQRAHISHTHTYSDLHIWGCSALLHQKIPKGMCRASGHGVNNLNIRGLNRKFWLHCCTVHLGQVAAASE